MEIYEAPIISTNSDLILVSTYSNSANSLLYYDLGQDSQLLIDSDDNYEECPLPFLKDCDLSGLANGQTWEINVEYEGGSGESTFLTNSPVNGTRIQYCLSKRVEEHCKLQFSLAIMVVVIICNLIKTTCMSIIAWKQDPEPLVTLGDAIASFLDRHDVTTEGNCIVWKTRFEDSRSWDLLLSNWDRKRLRWFQAASERRWLVCNVL